MDHLEYLKSGFEASQKRFQEAQQRMQAMQAEFQAVVTEFNAWQTLYRAEMAKQGTVPPEAPTSPQLPRNGRSVRLVFSTKPKSENNQTEMVRSILRAHPTGMKPAEIWQEVESRMANRTYLYSVLKRLKEREDIVERRGKYYPKVKPEGEAMVVQ